MDWTYISSALAIAFIVFVCGSILALLQMVWKTYRKINEMESQGLLRQRENLILFDTVEAVISCVQKGKCNGELDVAKKKIQSYMREEAVR